jgi:hypothetical protein
MSTVVRIDDLMAAADQSGWKLLTSAVLPLTCGVDIDVPDLIWNVPNTSMVSYGNASMMLSSGGNISGFNMPGLKKRGLRDKNVSTVGDGRTPSKVFFGR